LSSSLHLDADRAFRIVTKSGRTFSLIADSLEDKDRWANTIRLCITGQDVVDIARKQGPAPTMSPTPPADRGRSSSVTAFSAILSKGVLPALPPKRSASQSTMPLLGSPVAAPSPPPSDSSPVGRRDTDGLSAAELHTQNDALRAALAREQDAQAALSAALDDTSRRLDAARQERAAAEQESQRKILQLYSQRVLADTQVAMVMEDARSQAVERAQWQHMHRMEQGRCAQLSLALDTERRRVERLTEERDALESKLLLAQAELEQLPGRVSGTGDSAEAQSVDRLIRQSLPSAGSVAVAGLSTLPLVQSMLRSMDELKQRVRVAEADAAAAQTENAQLRFLATGEQSQRRQREQARLGQVGSALQRFDAAQEELGRMWTLIDGERTTRRMLESQLQTLTATQPKVVAPRRDVVTRRNPLFRASVSLTGSARPVLDPAVAVSPPVDVDPLAASDALLRAHRLLSGALPQLRMVFENSARAHAEVIAERDELRMELEVTRGQPSSPSGPLPAVESPPPPPPQLPEDYQTPEPPPPPTTPPLAQTSEVEAELRERVAELEEETALLRAHVDELQTQCAAAAAQIESAHADVKTARAETESARSAAAAGPTNASSMVPRTIDDEEVQAERAGLLALIEQTEGERDEAQAALERASRELATAHAAISDLEVARQVAAARAEEDRAHVAQLAALCSEWEARFAEQAAAQTQSAAGVPVPVPVAASGVEAAHWQQVAADLEAALAETRASLSRSEAFALAAAEHAALRTDELETERAALAERLQQAQGVVARALALGGETQSQLEAASLALEHERTSGNAADARADAAALRAQCAALALQLEAVYSQQTETGASEPVAADVQALSEEVAQWRVFYDEVQAQCRTLASEHADAVAQVESLRHARDDALAAQQHVAAELEQVLGALSTVRDVSTRAEAEHEQALAAATDELHGAHVQMRLLQSQLREVAAALGPDEDHESLASRALRVVSSQSRLQQRLSELETECDTLRGALPPAAGGPADADRADARAQIEALEAELDRVHAQLAESERLRDTLAGEAADLIRAERETARELASAQATVADLESELRVAIGDRDAALAVGSERSGGGDHSAELAAMSERLRDMDAVQHAAAHMRQDLEQRLAHATEVAASREAEADEARALCDEYQQRLAALEAQVRTVSAERDRAGADAAAARSALSEGQPAAAAALAEMSERVRDLEQQLAHSEQAAAQDAAGVDQARAALDVSERRLQDALSAAADSAELDALRADLAAMSQRLRDMDAVQHAAAHMRQDLEQRLGQASELVAAREAEADECRQRLQQALSDLDLAEARHRAALERFSGPAAVHADAPSLSSSADLARALQARDDALAELADVKAAMAQAAVENSAQWAQARDALAQCERKLQDALRAEEQTAAERDDVRAGLSLAQQSLAALQHTQASTAERAVQVDKEMRLLHDECAALERQLTDATTQLAAALQRSDEAVQQRDTALQQTAAVQEAHQQLQREVDELYNELDRVQQALEDAERRATEAQSALHAESASVQATGSERLQLLKLAESEQRARVQAEADVAELRTVLAARERMQQQAAAACARLEAALEEQRVAAQNERVMLTTEKAALAADCGLLRRDLSLALSVAEQESVQDDSTLVGGGGCCMADSACSSGVQDGRRGISRSGCHRAVRTTTRGARRHGSTLGRGSFHGVFCSSRDLTRYVQTDGQREEVAFLRFSLRAAAARAVAQQQRADGLAAQCAALNRPFVASATPVSFQ
jgi:chromosome segregation ATPase